MFVFTVTDVLFIKSTVAAFFDINFLCMFFKRIYDMEKNPVICRVF